MVWFACPAALLFTSTEGLCKLFSQQDESHPGGLAEVFYFADHVTKVTFHSPEAVPMSRKYNVNVHN